MARPLRIDYPGAFYHVMSRGNGGEPVFMGDGDRSRFLKYLERAVERFQLRIHTYCLMPNHYHLLAETPQANLSKAVQWINVSFAVYFNRRRQRSGHLFQGRFKAILVDSDEYLLPLSRYIHLNPVRAGLVDKSEVYRWSSYPAYTGGTAAPEWLEMGWLLSQFGSEKKQAASNYESYVDAVDAHRLEDPAKELVGGSILGSSGFVDWVKANLLSSRSANSEIPQLRQLRPYVEVEKIIASVSVEFKCTSRSVVTKNGKGNLARDVAIYLARELAGMSGRTLGECFGGVSGAAVTDRCKRTIEMMKLSGELTRKVERVKGRILDN